MTRDRTRDFPESGGPGGAAPRLAAAGVSPHRLLRLLLCLLLCLMAGCATAAKPVKDAKDAKGGQVVHRPKQPTRQPKPAVSGFTSADAKNIHDFLVKYQGIIAGEDEKAILLLYTDDARMVPYLVENKRVLTKKELESRLGQITKQQRRALMRLVFREPMDIKVSGETGQVQALADLTWREVGKARHTVLDCHFSLERVDYVWKIKQSHQEVAGPGQTAPGKGATPAIRPGPPGRQGTEPSSQPLVPADTQAPKPLF